MIKPVRRCISSNQPSMLQVRRLATAQFFTERWCETPVSGMQTFDILSSDQHISKECFGKRQWEKLNFESNSDLQHTQHTQVHKSMSQHSWMWYASHQYCRDGHQVRYRSRPVYSLEVDWQYTTRFHLISAVLLSNIILEITILQSKQEQGEIVSVFPFHTAHSNKKKSIF